MISCQELVDVLLDFHDGSLPPEHRLVAEQHVLACPGCRAYLESYRLTVRLARQLPATPLPDGLTARLRSSRIIALPA